VEGVDITTMCGMSDNEYGEFLRQVELAGLMYVDHHDILRSYVADYPLANSWIFLSNSCKRCAAKWLRVPNENEGTAFVGTLLTFIRRTRVFVLKPLPTKSLDASGSSVFSN